MIEVLVEGDRYKDEVAHIERYVRLGMAEYFFFHTRTSPVPPQ